MKNMDQDAHGREQVEVNSTIKEPQSTGENNSVESDGIDRRNFLSCMAWAGTGLLWTVAGGVPTSRLFAATGALAAQETHAQNSASLRFVQISDSHIGFNKAANQDVTGTFKLALDKINQAPECTRSSATHRRYYPLVEDDGVRHGATTHQGDKGGREILRSWRA